MHDRHNSSLRRAHPLLYAKNILSQLIYLVIWSTDARRAEHDIKSLKTLSWPSLLKVLHYLQISSVSLLKLLSNKGAAHLSSHNCCCSSTKTDNKHRKNNVIKWFRETYDKLPSTNVSSYLLVCCIHFLITAVVLWIKAL